MADTYSIKGGAAVKWGAANVTTLGTCLSHSEKDDAKTEPVPNDQGATVGEVLYDIEKQVQIEILAPSSGTRPVPGTVLTIDGITGLLVMSSEKKAEGKGLTKWSVTAKKYTNSTFV